MKVSPVLVKKLATLALGVVLALGAGCDDPEGSGKDGSSASETHQPDASADGSAPDDGASAPGDGSVEDAAANAPGDVSPAGDPGSYHDKETCTTAGYSWLVDEACDPGGRSDAGGDCWIESELCVKHCGTDADCADTGLHYCRVMGLTAGGDWDCNATTMVCTDDDSNDCEDL